MGDEGYAWIHEDLIKEYWLDSRIEVPDVEPGELLAIRGHRHRELVGKCEKEKLPDSISGMCAASARTAARATTTSAPT